MLLSPHLTSYVDRTEVVITGTSDKMLGSARAITRAHANLVHVLFLAGTEKKVMSVIHEIQAIDPLVETTSVYISFDDLDSVRKATVEANSSVNKIDVLISNTSMMTIQKYTTSKDCVEMMLATNCVGHFLLSKSFMDKILAPGKRYSWMKQSSFIRRPVKGVSTMVSA